MDRKERDRLGPEQVRHLTAPAESPLLQCLEALLPPDTDARDLVDIGAVYVDRVRWVIIREYRSMLARGRRGEHTVGPAKESCSWDAVLDGCSPRLASLGDTLICVLRLYCLSPVQSHARCP
jgi:hypothetical protein